MNDARKAKFIERAKQLRRRQTKAEELLWAVLRGRRLCSIKFRRQHPIPPFVADFACSEERLVIEIDGGYHDEVYEADVQREAKIRSKGWQILRFTNEEVLNDVDAVAVAIAKHLGKDWRS